MKNSGSISYDQQTVDAPNHLARFSHRRRARRSLALTKHYLPVGGTVVDFGAANCRLLISLAADRQDANLIALEPYMEHIRDKRIAYVDSLSTLRETVDVITAFETCEHLSDDDLRAFLTDANAALMESGTLILSVPIMIGTALLPKELNRITSFGGRSDYSLTELLGESARCRSPGHSIAEGATKASTSVVSSGRLPNCSSSARIDFAAAAALVDQFPNLLHLPEEARDGARLGRAANRCRALLGFDWRHRSPQGSRALVASRPLCFAADQSPTAYASKTP